MKRILFSVLVRYEFVACYGQWNVFPVFQSHLVLLGFLAHWISQVYELLDQDFLVHYMVFGVERYLAFFKLTLNLFSVLN